MASQFKQMFNEQPVQPPTAPEAAVVKHDPNTWERFTAKDLDDIKKRVAGFLKGPKVATTTTKVAVVMVNNGVKCVEPFNPEIEDEQAIINRHRQDQVAIFKQRHPQGNPADHFLEVGHVHVHVHDLVHHIHDLSTQPKPES